MRLFRRESVLAWKQNESLNGCSSKSTQTSLVAARPGPARSDPLQNAKGTDGLDEPSAVDGIHVELRNASHVPVTMVNVSADVVFSRLHAGRRQHAFGAASPAASPDKNQTTIELLAAELPVGLPHPSHRGGYRGAPSCPMSGRRNLACDGSR